MEDVQLEHDLSQKLIASKARVDESLHHVVSTSSVLVLFEGVEAFLDALARYSARCQYLPFRKLYHLASLPNHPPKTNLITFAPQ